MAAISRRSWVEVHGRYGGVRAGGHNRRFAVGRRCCQEEAQRVLQPFIGSGAPAPCLRNRQLSSSPIQNK